MRYPSSLLYSYYVLHEFLSRSLSKYYVIILFVIPHEA